MRTSFQSILEGVRKELALDYLQQTEMAIEAVADGIAAAKLK